LQLLIEASEMTSSRGGEDDAFNFDAYYAQRRLVAENYFVPALAGCGLDFSGMTALEVGCGRGVKSAVFSGLFKHYVGVDLDKAEIEIAAENVKRAGRENCEIFCANFTDVLQNPGRFGLEGEPDFLVLYAVLEHMLPHERHEALRMAARTVERGGAVFLAETQNRLIPFDSHSSQLHFVQSLPPDLALRYLRSSPHKQWMHSFNRMGGDVTALYRCGLGLSYHDFELDFCSESKTSEIPFAFTGWSSLLVRHQPLQNDEVWLHRYMTDNGLAVHPAFARYWIEGLVSRRAPMSHHWTQIAKLGGQHPSAFLSRPSCSALDQWNVEFGDEICARFSETPAADSFEYVLQLAMASSAGVVHIMAGDSIIAEIDMDELKRSRAWAWHQLLVFSLNIPRFYSALRVRPASHKARIGVQAVIVNGYVRGPGPAPS
jgi:2-polyprenyl-3-methyl-5-hydroxy-6-metoxy-1,4-benzoquinol methylase